MRKLIISIILLSFSTSVLALPKFRCVPDCSTPIQFRDAGIYEIFRRGWTRGAVTIVNSKKNKMDVELRLSLVRGFSPGGISFINFQKWTLDVEAQNGSFQKLYNLKKTTIYRILAQQKRLRTARTRAPNKYEYIRSFGSPVFRPTYNLPSYNLNTNKVASAPSFVGAGRGRVTYGAYGPYGPQRGFSGGSPSNIVPAMIRAARLDPVGVIFNLTKRKNLIGLSAASKAAIFNLLRITEAFYRSKGGKT